MTKRIEIKGIESITFDSFPSAPSFGHKWPPPGHTDTTDTKQSRANAILQQAIRAMETLDAQVYAVRKDASRNPVYRAEMVVPHRKAAQKAIDTAKDFLKTEGQRIAAARAKLNAPPALDQQDFAGAVADTEIRQRFAALPPAAKLALQDQIGKHDPAQDRIAHALTRDPFTTPDSQWARAVHADRVAVGNPVAVAALNSDTELHGWAVAGVNALGDVLRKTEADGLPALIPEVQAA